MDRTVKYLTKIWPHTTPDPGSHVDPFAQEIFSTMLDNTTLSQLYEYTRGMYTTELHYKSFLKYDRSIQDELQYCSTIHNCKFIRQAVNQVSKDLQIIKGLKPIRQSNFDAVRWIPTSAAGFSYIGKKADNYEIARRRATYHLGTFKSNPNYQFTPDKAFARTQLALRADPKIRHVWGRPFHTILIEGLFAQPIIDALIKTNTPIYIGHDLHKDMPQMAINLISNGGTIYGLDIKGFDNSVCQELKLLAFSIVEDLFEDWDEYSINQFNYIKANFMVTPVVMPDGKIFSCETGIPSGSYFTQIIGSIINLILCYAAQIKLYNQTFVTYVLGDDSLFVVPEHSSFPIESFAEALVEYGITVSIDKSFYTTNYHSIMFLGHNFYGSRVSRDEFTALSLALHTEQEVSTPQQSIIRIASLLYDSGFNSLSMYNLLNLLLNHHDIDWSSEPERPVTTSYPFNKLFYLS